MSTPAVRENLAATRIRCASDGRAQFIVEIANSLGIGVASGFNVVVYLVPRPL